MSTEPTPEAVVAIVEAMSAPGHDLPHAAGQRALAFIRDAIHRDGTDADAIREALGLARERAVQHDGRRSPQFANGRPVHRVASDWQEVQP